MGPLRQQLLEMIQRDDRYDLPASYLDPLRLEAARELFAERREQISVLRRRAEDTGVTEIRKLRGPGAAAVLAHGLQVLPAESRRPGQVGRARALAQDAVGRGSDQGRRLGRHQRRCVDRPHARCRPPAARHQRLERQVLVPEFDAWRSRDEEAPLGEDARLAEAHAEARSRRVPARSQPRAQQRHRGGADRRRSSGAGPDRSTS